MSIENTSAPAPAATPAAAAPAASTVAPAPAAASVAAPAPAPAVAPAAAAQTLLDGAKPNATGEHVDGELNEDGTPKAKAAEPVVPEVYEFKMPDGMVLDQAAADAFTAVAKEHKLTQDQATKFTGIAVEMQRRNIEAHANQVAAWAEEVKADKEIGGDNLQATLTNTNKVMATFGTDALKTALNQSGYGNHPEFIKFVNKIGKAISEDSFVKGGSVTPTGSVEDRMFPSMTPKS